jgi:glyoxylase I family protein
MITGIEHVGLCADDPANLVRWYVEVLGFALVRPLEGYRTYFIRAQNGGMLEIYPAQHTSPSVDNVHRGLRHIALSVVDFDREIVRIRSSGVDIPVDDMVTTSDMKLAFFRDPEGNILHLVERKEEIP